MPKKFEIHNPENLKKNFEIERRKSFILETEALSQARPEWFRQTNAYDCGPGLLLNSLHALHIEGIPQTVGELRAAINELRANLGEAALPEHGWFTTRDINGYLGTKGFIPRGYGSNDPQSLRDVRRDISQQAFDFSYTSYPGSHYRGFIPADQPGEFFLLDSFSEGPQRILQEEFDAIVRDTLTPSPRSGRFENFVVVRKKRD